MIPPPPFPPAQPDATAPAPDVIDLRRGRPAGTTRVRIARHENPYEHLAPDERVKVIIRVLCGLVAYDEEDDEIIDVDAAGTADQTPVPGPTVNPTSV